MNESPGIQRHELLPSLAGATSMHPGPKNLLLPHPDGLKPGEILAAPAGDGPRIDINDSHASVMNLFMAMSQGLSAGHDGKTVRARNAEKKLSAVFGPQLPSPPITPKPTLSEPPTIVDPYANVPAEKGGKGPQADAEGIRRARERKKRKFLGR